MNRLFVLLAAISLFACTNPKENSSKSDSAKSVSSLPHPFPEFTGEIGRTYKESEMASPRPARATKGSAQYSGHTP